MKKFIYGILLLLAGTTSAFAQNKNITVSGTIIEADTKQPIEQATVRLLSLPDSTYITGAASLAKGRFTLPKVKAGKYVLMVSYIGFHTKDISLRLLSSALTKNVGVVSLSPDAIMLKEAVITAEAPQVTVSEDTLVYNSSAYRVPEGSMLEELVKKLPGAEVADDGTITINGKTITKIMVDGKEFFTKDPKVAMKNLPVDMIDKIKAYDKQSDMARITGIDDGEEESVIDLTIKKGMNQGWFGNFDAGYGNKERYIGKAMLNRFSDGNQFSVVANANNINDQGFPGGGGFRRGGGSNNGINAVKTTGVNFAHDTKKLELGGSVDYSHSNKDVKTNSMTETFLQDGSSYSKGLSAQLNEAESVNADFRMEWKPDSLTDVIFRPSFSYSSSNNLSNSHSLMSDADNLSQYALEESLFDQAINDDDLVNYNFHKVNSLDKGISTDGDLQLNRKLGKKGRNVTLRISYGYSDDNADQYSDSKVRYFKRDSTSIQSQYIDNENKGYNYRIQTTYSEPVFTNRFLQFSYSYQYKYQKTDKDTYDMLQGDDYLSHPIDSLSKYYENEYYTHEFNLSLRTIRDKYQYNIGFSVLPQESTSIYELGTTRNELSKSVVNYSPTFDYRYRFNKQSQLRINYRGRTSQPSMTDLQPVRDVSDPLNIKEGNPGLKPSFNNTFRLFYNTYIPERQQGLMTSLNFSNTINSISNVVTYDSETGGKVTRPENINGNWSMNGTFVFNTPFKNKKFSISTYSNGSYSNMVGFTSLSQNEDAVKNTTRSMNLSERLNSSYRNDWFEFGLNAGVFYNLSKNSLQSQGDKETFDYLFGANSNVTLPWSVTLSTDASYSMKKGYSEGLDRNEMIWNAQLTKNFLKKKQATISFQIYDILKEQSNLSRNITASMRQDTEYNAINSYFMFHFIYRLNAFGGKGGRNSEGGPDRRGGRGGRGGYGGGRPF
ncbi:TonB-dependent receptor [uncultured Bacteroides sp.]|uniref:TonB-dependent receptor n=1 Tax=uncultured Bacteroides sp. TaxID=162156 RepID=UPI002AA6F8CD|nr:TonB-dependent receptor [uncultured Bacteroides sp.]